MSFHKAAKQQGRGKESEAVLPWERTHGLIYTQVCACCVCRSNLVGLQVWSSGWSEGFWRWKGWMAIFSLWWSLIYHSFECLILSTANFVSGFASAAAWALSCETHQRRWGRSSFHDECCFVTCVPTAIWDSKGEIWFSCTNLSVDIPLHSSEMKRLLLLQELLSY